MTTLVTVILLAGFLLAAWVSSAATVTTTTVTTTTVQSDFWHKRYLRMKRYARRMEIKNVRLRKRVLLLEAKLRGRRSPNRGGLSGPVTATWYGPGFYGNGTACGLTLAQSSWWVAHRSLACGTIVTLCEKLCIRAPVGDRGPYSAATFDLSPAVAKALGGYYTHSVRYRIG